MTEEKIQQLRNAGISDEVIIDMMKKPEEGRSEGYIDPTTPSSTFTQAQAAGTPTTGPDQTMTQTGTEAAMLVPDALKYAGGGALGYYGLKKLGQAIGGRGAPGPVGPMGAPGPAGPAGAPGVPFSQTPQATFDALKTPEAQLNQPRPAPAQQPSIVQRGMDMASKVRQVAMDRVITPAMEAAPRVAQAAAPLARAAGGITAAVMPGNVGQNYPFPMSGPMKGQEINPTTGAPWTAQELSAYRAQYGT